jgi:hypothetical protein
MSPRDDGGPAFPSEGEGHGNPKYHSPGMTLRDWFAGQVLIAMGTWSPAPYNHYAAQRVAAQAAHAYEVADAMLAERAKP